MFRSRLNEILETVERVERLSADHKVDQVIDYQEAIIESLKDLITIARMMGDELEELKREVA